MEHNKNGGRTRHESLVGQDSTIRAAPSDPRATVGGDVAMGYARIRLK